MSSDWDYSTDLLVVGSGGGGMTAALFAHDLGSRALILEKSDCFGGSTAISGGSIWVPNNHLMGQAGLNDSADAALRYLETLTSGEVPEERLRAYLEASPKVVEYLEENSHVHFVITPGYPDYYADVPGSMPEGRTLEPLPFPVRKLGPMGKELRPPTAQGVIWGRWAVTAKEAQRCLSAAPLTRLQMAWQFAKYLLNPARSFARRDMRLSLGNALAARFRLSLADRGIPLWLDTAAIRLLVEDERVVGVEAERDGKRIRIRAEKGVLLAAGGFEKNPEMRKKHHLSADCATWSMGSPENMGDAIRMGVDAGASVALMESAWWMPTVMIPGHAMPWYVKGSWWTELALKHGAEIPWFTIFERSLPGTIIVDSKGKRFTNESAPYLDVGKAQIARHRAEQSSVPAFQIADQRFHMRYPYGPIMPMMPTGKFVRSGLVKKADTLAELARQCDIDPAGLEREVERYNRGAQRGEDPDFRRGEQPIDRFYGDPAVKPNPCLATIEKPPYYAMAIYPGDIGTKGGLRTDADARVLREDDSPIAGLYATGNCSASVMGDAYPGAGGTIGPSMAFAYLAALHALEAPHALEASHALEAPHTS